MARSRRTASKSVRVNFKDVESRKTPPEGDYILEVLEAESGKSGNKNDQIEFTLEIAEGDYKGTKVWFYCTLDEKSLWKLHAFLTAMGVDVPQDEFDIDLSELPGKQVVGVLTHETYQGRKRAKMTDFDSVENFTGEREGKKGKKDKKDKKGKKDKDEAPAKDKKKDKKDKAEPETKSKKDKKEKKPKKITEADVEDMDEDELESLVSDHKLKVDLDDFPKLGKKRKAVVKALTKKGIIE